MQKLIGTIAVSVLLATSAIAQGVEPAVVTQAKVFCVAFSEKQVALSKDAFFACQTEEWPRITLAGRFRNTGIGAEFNTLIRNEDHLLNETVAAQ